MAVNPCSGKAACVQLNMGAVCVGAQIADQEKTLKYVEVEKRAQILQATGWVAACRSIQHTCFLALCHGVAARPSHSGSDRLRRVALVCWCVNNSLSQLLHSCSHVALVAIFVGLVRAYLRNYLERCCAESGHDKFWQCL
eukprot:jgi/Ulvmu1/10344/UM061_0027.1